MIEDQWNHMWPSMWECKDFADGWIQFPAEADALEYQRETGCLVRIYYRPAPAQAGAVGEAA